MKDNSALGTRLGNPSLPADPRRVLVLEDDADILACYALTLGRAGYWVDTGTDGEQGWEAICATDYKLLLTDNDMPRLTGIELVWRLRQAGITLPVILASGSMALPTDDDRGLLGLTAVLRKPFAPHELVDAVQRVVPLQGIPAPLACHRESPQVGFLCMSRRSL